MKQLQLYQQIILGVLVIALIVGGYFTYRSFALQSELEETRANAATTERELSDTVAQLEEALTQMTDARDRLSEELAAEKAKVGAIQEQIDEISGTVGILDKLAKTDPELLQKYSKVYFLNEHYVPPRIDEIEAEYTYDETRTYELHADVMPFFEDMVEDALEDGINLWVVSAFRSFYDQQTLKGAYTVTYGSGANTFSADQGYSEHQLGTTVDFTTNGLGGGLRGFGNTEAYQWLLDNAYKYGFVLSYPEGNQYYIFEPWHWRFVGRDLARYLNREELNFYDVDQRKIDEYLVSIFD